MLNACIVLKVVPVKAYVILSAIKEIDGVRKAYFTYGRFDIVVFVEVTDYKELRAVTTKINGIEGIRSTETLPEA
jgi:DNA-binding Lrp family transcriptional regulator